jgi:hypothetical protein
MTPSTFEDRFRAAFGQEVTPFDYQGRLAGGKDGTSCESKLINAGERIFGRRDFR